MIIIIIIIISGVKEVFLGGYAASLQNSFFRASAAHFVAAHVPNGVQIQQIGRAPRGTGGA